MPLDQQPPKQTSKSYWDVGREQPLLTGAIGLSTISISAITNFARNKPFTPLGFAAWATTAIGQVGGHMATEKHKETNPHKGIGLFFANTVLSGFGAGLMKFGPNLRGMMQATANTGISGPLGLIGKLLPEVLTKSGDPRAKLFGTMGAVLIAGTSGMLSSTANMPNTIRSALVEGAWGFLEKAGIKAAHSALKEHQPKFAEIQSDIQSANGVKDYFRRGGEKLARQGMEVVTNNPYLESTEPTPKAPSPSKNVQNVGQKINNPQERQPQERQQQPAPPIAPKQAQQIKGP